MELHFNDEKYSKQETDTKIFQDNVANKMSNIYSTDNKKLTSCLLNIMFERDNKVI